MTVRTLLQRQCDDAWRRLVDAVVGERVKHYSAALQMTADGDARTRLIWIVDLLPNEISLYIDGQMDQAVLAMQKALDATPHSQRDLSHRSGTRPGLASERASGLLRFRGACAYEEQNHDWS